MKNIRDILVNKISSEAYDWDIDTLVDFAIEKIEESLTVKTDDELKEIIISNTAMTDEQFEEFLSVELLRVP